MWEELKVWSPLQFDNMSLKSLGMQWDMFKQSSLIFNL